MRDAVDAGEFSVWVPAPVQLRHRLPHRRRDPGALGPSHPGTAVPGGVCPAAGAQRPDLYARPVCLGRGLPVYAQNGWTTPLCRPSPCRSMCRGSTSAPRACANCCAGSRTNMSSRGECLRLEITESAYMEEPEQLVAVAGMLQKLGFPWRWTTSGSGYSSLNTLKEVPVDVLKLDMRFLANCGDSVRGGNILSSVVRMAHWMGPAGHCRRRGDGGAGGVSQEPGLQHDAGIFLCPTHVCRGV